MSPPAFAALNGYTKVKQKNAHIFRCERHHLCQLIVNLSAGKSLLRQTLSCSRKLISDKETETPRQILLRQDSSRLWGAEALPRPEGYMW